MATHELIKLLGANLDEVRSCEFVKRLNSRMDEMAIHRHHLDFPDAGISITSDDGLVVSAVALYAEGYEAHNGYTGTLPGGIAFTNSRGKVRDLLGSPKREHDGGVRIQGIGVTAPWDGFECFGASLQVRYSHDKMSVVLVTILPCHVE